MRNVRWIDELKLRASWGQLGNEKIWSSYAGIDILSIGSCNYIWENQQVTGAATSYIADKSLTWETTTQYNIGLDLFWCWHLADYDWPGGASPTGKYAVAPLVLERRTDGTLAKRSFPGWEAYRDGAGDSPAAAPRSLFRDVPPDAGQPCPEPNRFHGDGLSRINVGTAICRRHRDTERQQTIPCPFGMRRTHQHDAGRDDESQDE